MAKDEKPDACSVGPRLHEITPREVTGRDVIERFQAQFRGAALACLEILEGSTLDHVYCDFQDDFVTRQTSNGVVTYRFYQVKTKSQKKHQWTRYELFGVRAKCPSVSKNHCAPAGDITTPATTEQLKSIRTSFVGKLLEHAIAFGESCKAVSFLTNAHFDDDVERIGGAIEIGNVGERTVRYLSDNFVAAFEIKTPFDISVAHKCIRKLTFVADQAHLDPHCSDFDAKARQKVWEFSEIDLTHIEAQELIGKLLSLVQKQSSSKLISQLSAADLDREAGVGLEDLLNLLPLSRAAYEHFLSGGDTSALRSASILQRTMEKAGATPELIEAASVWKIAWDNWFRTHRHNYEFEITFLRDRINEIYRRWARSEVTLFGLESEVSNLRASLSDSLAALIQDTTLMGGIFAELVRSKSK